MSAGNSPSDSSNRPYSVHPSAFVDEPCRYAFVWAGAVIRGDVPDYALMLGVPARHRGWMSRHGHRLSIKNEEGVFVCSESEWRYQEVEERVLRCLDWPEDEPLP